jgi:hypothetical protein
MTKFEDKFFTLLEGALDIDAEAQAFAGELDEGTPPESMGASDMSQVSTANDEVSKALSQQAQLMEDTISDWIGQFEVFLELLNGTSAGSIQSQLAQAESDTILDRMKQSEQRKIARVATELAALTESFKGFLAQSENAAFRHV